MSTYSFVEVVETGRGVKEAFATLVDWRRDEPSSISTTGLSQILDKPMASDKAYALESAPAVPSIRSGSTVARPLVRAEGDTERIGWVFLVHATV